MFAYNKCIFTLQCVLFPLFAFGYVIHFALCVFSAQGGALPTPFLSPWQAQHQGLTRTSMPQRRHSESQTCSLLTTQHIHTVFHFQVKYSNLLKYSAYIFSFLFCKLDLSYFMALVSFHTSPLFFNLLYSVTTYMTLLFSSKPPLCFVVMTCLWPLDVHLGIMHLL